MDKQDTAGVPARRLEELERRLEGAFRDLAGRGSVAAREGESLRARRARLREQLQAGSSGSGVLGEIEAWIGRLDRDQTRDDVRTARRKH
jgi:hypothetical protein